MIDYKYFDLFQKDNVDKQAIIEYSGGIMTNEELFQNSELLTESLCSEKELRFGCCEASSLKFKVANIVKPMMGETVKFSIAIGHHKDEPLVIGNYKVASDKLTADRRYRDIIAYDAMYDIINTDVADWYNSILPNKTSTVTLKQFRASFVSYFGLIQEEIDLVNDGMVVEKTIEPSEISGKDVITAICEINGCFGHIGRGGKFRYILLPKYIEGLYPANDLFPADDLYPRNPNTTKISNSLHISCKYEDFVTHKIDKLQIRQTKDDIGSIVGTGTNCYIVEDNFLTYGKSASDLATIANNLFSIITDISYRPFNADCKGNPCFEIGDAVRLTTKYDIVESYILKRTLKGVQALKDAYSSDGVLEYSEKVNSVNKSIIQLKGKTNELERTVEETKSTITDVEKGLQSQITQNAESITTEVKRAQGQEVELAAAISITSEEITSEVSRAKGQEEKISAAVQITADAVKTKVSKDSVVSEINQSAEGLKIKANLLEMQGTVEMTGGYMHIDAGDSEGNPNLIHFTRGETEIGIGNDGMYANGGGRSAIFQYNQIGVSYGDLIAFLKDDGKGISSYGWESYSDARLKHDIEPLNIHERAKFIYAQEPCRFKYNYDPDGHYRHGLIAQKTQKTIGAEDWELCGESANTDGKTYLTLNYLELIADLIATVQSQNERIEALEGKLNEQNV